MTSPPPSHSRPCVRVIHDRKLPVVIFEWGIGCDDIGEGTVGGDESSMLNVKETGGTSKSMILPTHSTGLVSCPIDPLSEWWKQGRREEHSRPCTIPKVIILTELGAVRLQAQYTNAHSHRISVRIRSIISESALRSKVLIH